MEYQRRGIQLSPELWLVKIMVRGRWRHTHLLEVACTSNVASLYPSHTTVLFLCAHPLPPACQHMCFYSLLFLRLLQVGSIDPSYDEGDE